VVVDRTTTPRDQTPNGRPPHRGTKQLGFVFKAASCPLGWPAAAALRHDQWKLNFLEQRAHGFDVWEEPFVELRLPKLFTLRGDPFERGEHEGIGYPRWRIDRAFMLVPAQVYVSKWLRSFAEFPPRMKAASFGIDAVMRKMVEGSGNDRCRNKRASLAAIGRRRR
jgi:hypothetical protein